MANGKQPETVNTGTGEIGGPVQVDTASELMTSSLVATVTAEIQGAMILAKKFPRNYQAVWADLMEACERPKLAKKAHYKLPMGGRQITGMSVNLARVAAQCFGNMRWGVDIISEDEEKLYIVGWAWDLQKNVKVPFPDVVHKRIYRKATGWRTADDREVRLEINRRGAFLIRNAIYNVLPKDYVDDAEARCRKTIKDGIKDPTLEKKGIITKFKNLGVTVEMVNEYLDNENWTVDQMIDLKAILNTIEDGGASVSTYFGNDDKKPEKEKVPEMDMSAGDAADHQDIKGDAKKDKPEKSAKDKTGKQTDAF